MPLLQSRSDRLRHGPSRHTPAAARRRRERVPTGRKPRDRPGDWC